MEFVPRSMAHAESLLSESGDKGEDTRTMHDSQFALSNPLYPRGDVRTTNPVTGDGRGFSTRREKWKYMLRIQKAWGVYADSTSVRTNGEKDIL